MGKKTGLNSISSKYYNRGLLLQLVATGECRTRGELSRTTGLAKMTVSNIVTEFIEKNILAECEEELTEVCGRNPIILKVSEKAPKVIGLLIFRDRVESVLCDLNMRILDRRKICFTELTEKQLMEYSYQVVDELLEKEKNIAGMGVAVIGPVDIKKGIILNPVRFYNISNVPVLKLLQNRYDFPIYLDHDNNSAALAEKLYGVGKGVHDFIFLGVSNGIGSGVICNDQVYHSQRGLEPEIGHVSIDYKGPLCSCGNRGCLEMYASAYVLQKRFRKITGLDMEYSEYCHMEENEQIRKIFEDTVEKVSVALTSSINILQPELIILGHECMDWDEKYVNKLEKLINEKKMAEDLYRISVKKAYFGKDAQLIGAAANMANQMFRGKYLGEE